MLYAGIAEYVAPLIMEQRANAANQQARLCELSWLGGIIDGEGCITVDKKAQECVHPLITIVNTDKRITDKVIQIFTAYGVAFYVREHPAKGNWKAKIEIVVAGFKRVDRFLRVIRPYLVSKAERADKILLLCEMRVNARRAPYTDAEKNLCRDVWKLNGRGTDHWAHTKASTTVRKAREVLS